MSARDGRWLSDAEQLPLPRLEHRQSNIFQIVLNMSAFPHCAVYAPIRATMADQRFAALTNDPRYRLPSKKTNRTALDPRFNRLLTSRDFTRKAKVDRYGRKIEGEQGWKGLEKQQLYRLDGAEQKPAKRSAEREREVVSSSAEASQDSEGGVEKAVKRDPARDGGFSDSESSEEESSSEEEESADEAALAAETAGQEQQEEIPLGEVTTRIAAVNLDWDHIRASDIMAVAQSFIPTSGRIERVSVYPSEFGREQAAHQNILKCWSRTCATTNISETRDACVRLPCIATDGCDCSLSRNAISAPQELRRCSQSAQKSLTSPELSGLSSNRVMAETVQSAQPPRL